MKTEGIKDKKLHQVEKMQDKKIDNLDFILSKSEESLNEIFNFNVKAFADTQDFIWTIDNIKSEISSGWSPYSVKMGKEVVCVLFAKKDGASLLTKNTPIKIDFQGQGVSHKIKDFYEELADDHKVEEIRNYCPDDNFRMIGLNESHHYSRTGEVSGPNHNIIEWVKPWEAK